MSAGIELRAPSIWSCHIDVSMGLGSLSNKVRCTVYARTLSRCMSVICSNLCNEGRLMYPRCRSFIMYV